MSDAIADFWTWWANHSDRIAATYDDGAPGDWVKSLSARVSAIHEKLVWEIGQGAAARHHLAVGSGGDPALRVLAERWCRAGPGDDEVFEFYTARQRSTGGTIEMDALTFDIDGMVFSVEVDDSRQRFDVGVWHPIFADIPPNVADRFLWIGIDNLLGEDDVTTWLGEIERREWAPDEVVTAPELISLVDAAEERWPAETFTVLKGETDGEVRWYTANLSAKFLRHWAFDTLYLVRLPFVDRGDGLPTKEDGALMYTLSESLSDVDGALFLLSITGGGERLQYLYLQAQMGPARRELDRLMAGHEAATVRVSHDPGWQQLPKL